MSDTNATTPPPPSSPSWVKPGLIGVAIGAALSFLVLNFVVIQSQKTLYSKALQQSMTKTTPITRLQEDHATLKDKQTLYELSNTQNLALIAKLRGFCGKPCEGVQ